MNMILSNINEGDGTDSITPNIEEGEKKEELVTPKKK
jgi:hypothetical protein